LLAVAGFGHAHGSIIDIHQTDAFQLTIKVRDIQQTMGNAGFFKQGFIA